MTRSDWNKVLALGIVGGVAWAIYEKNKRDTAAFPGSSVAPVTMIPAPTKKAAVRAMEADFIEYLLS